MDKLCTSNFYACNLLDMAFPCIHKLGFKCIKPTEEILSEKTYLLNNSKRPQVIQKYPVLSRSIDSIFNKSFFILPRKS